PARQLFIRAAFAWGVRYRKREMAFLGKGNLRSAIKTLANAVGVSLSSSDFDAFIEREATLQAEVGLIPREQAARAVSLRLRVPCFEELQSAARWTSRQSSRARNLLRRVAGR